MLRKIFDDKLISNLERVIEVGFRDTVAGKKKIPEKFKNDEILQSAWMIGKEDAEQKISFGAD